MTIPVPTRVVVVVNSAAGRGRGGEVGHSTITAFRSAGYAVPDLQDRAVDLFPAFDSPLPFDALVVVGGDGTVNRAVELLAGTGIPLGIIPTGTGNDLARGLGIPIGDTDAAIHWITAALSRPPRLIDTGLITRADGSTQRFGGVFSGGIDAIVNERANRMRRPRGRSRYTLALLRELVTLRPIPYEVELDGETSAFAATLIAVANNSSFGGGMKVAPSASLDDGVFDVVWLTPVGRMSLLRIFPKVFTGAHIRDPRVTVRKAARVRIDAAGIVAYADGERIGALPLTVEVVPRSLAVLV